MIKVSFHAVPEMLLLLEKLLVEPEHRALQTRQTIMQSDPLTNYYCEVQLQMRKMNGNLFPIEERVSDPCFKYVDMLMQNGVTRGV